MANPDRNVSGDSRSKPEEHLQVTAAPEQRKSGGSLDLNRATEPEIAEIDMIGKKLARTLVQMRSQRGGFRNWDELKEVPGLDPMKIAELQRAARLDD